MRATVMTLACYDTRAPRNPLGGEWTSLLSVASMAMIAVPSMAAAEKGRAVRSAHATVTIIRPFVISSRKNTRATIVHDSPFINRRTVIENCPPLSTARFNMLTAPPPVHPCASLI